MSELQPFLKAVRLVRKRNPQVDWHAAHSRWRAVIDHCREIVDEARTSAHVRYVRQAAELLIQIDAVVETDRLIDLASAVAMLQAFQASRFKSDTAYAFCLVHVLRREAKAGRMFHVRPKKTLATYRELSKKTRQTMAKWINDGRGLIAVTIAQTEVRRLTARADAETKFKETVAAIA